MYHKVFIVYRSALSFRLIIVTGFLFNLIFLTSFLYASEPINIGLSLGLTGKYQKMSIAQKNGFLLWEETVNKGGGILGREVRLNIYDDKSDPKIAQSIYTKMIETDRVDFVFAPFSSDITEAILPVTEKHNYCVLASGAAADRLWNKGYKSLFGMFTPASRISVSFLEMLALYEFKRVAIIYEDEPFSMDIASGSKKWAKRFGMEVVVYEKHLDAQENIEQLATKVKNSGAEALIIGGYLNDAVSFRRALQSIDWYPKAFYAPQGPGIPAFQDLLKEAAEYTFSTSQWEMLSGIHHPGSREFVRAYEKNYNTTPLYFAATAFAAGQILEAAIKKAGNTDRNHIRGILSSFNMRNIIGRYGVDQRGMQLKSFTLVVQVLNGKREVVWPLKLMNAKPVFK